jgi:predicted Na+-dependent transporter
MRRKDPFTLTLELRRRYIADRYWLAAAILAIVAGSMTSGRWQILVIALNVLAFVTLAIGFVRTRMLQQERSKRTVDTNDTGTV